MDRFLSNTVNRVDKKGRVSIPASFRTVLADRSSLHLIMSVEHPAAEAGGAEFLEANLERLAEMDQFSEEYEMWSFCLLGDAAELKIDSEGRIILTDQIREHTGISEEAAFVGRGHFFQIWEPSRFQAYREKARASVREMRKRLGNSNSPESQAEPTPPNPPKGSGFGKKGNKGQRT